MLKLFRVITFLAIGFFFLPYANGHDFDFMDLNNAIPSSGTGTTFISGQTFSDKQVVYDKKNGWAILEGDILIGTVSQAEARYQYGVSHPKPFYSIIISGNNFRWINNIVPFQFAPGVTPEVQNMVNNAVTHWQANSDIQFVLRTPANANQFPDFVTIVSGQNACFSWVGRQGGSQDLNVVAACGFGGTVHELGHALGLWHEQSREDRDNFVRINWANIQVGQEHNFNQHIDDGDDVGNYDYGSIMHYGAFDFSANNLPTITPLQNVPIGQRNGLSPGDIASIRSHYPPVVPVARLSRRTYSVFFGSPVLIDGSLSFDPRGGALNFTWNLGDGPSFTNQTNAILHTYASRGTFDIQLTVVNPQGLTASDSARAVVYGSEILVPIVSLLN